MSDRFVYFKVKVQLPEWVSGKGALKLFTDRMPITDDGIFRVVKISLDGEKPV